MLQRLHLLRLQLATPTRLPRTNVMLPPPPPLPKPIGQSATHAIACEGHGHQAQRQALRQIIRQQACNSSSPDRGTDLNLLVNKAPTCQSRTAEPTEDDDDTDRAIFLLDLAQVVRQQRRFERQLPNVQPFYAVKCNPDPHILRALDALGVNFDCASKGEMAQVLDMGVAPERIIFANPCKPISHLRAARRWGVQLMTFDNEDELDKIHVHYPEAQLVLRVLADDSSAVCRLGLKFGAPLSVVPRLLRRALELDLNLVGVSFHVGSGCTDANAFADAVHRARQVFDMATELGVCLKILDVGGGFPGADETSTNSKDVTFADIAHHLRQALQRHFGHLPDLTIMAEPGRFYAHSAVTLAVNVIARRGASGRPGEEDHVRYYVSDGVYGSFNCLLFDHASVRGLPLLRAADADHDPNHVDHDLKLHASSVWGPTCDSLDCIAREAQLPLLEVGDWLVYHDMGAYTACAASTFNGFVRPRCYYTFGADPIDAVLEMLPNTFPLHGHLMQLAAAMQGAIVATSTITGRPDAHVLVEGDLEDTTTALSVSPSLAELSLMGPPKPAPFRPCTVPAYR
ncbi:uncharacterized protein MONBRDRAFT_28648 [Monosiga brevicollis MX1]|uniref:ornithine decarboxylase n=1 Tax=Monosiga brevicollis TaxID=81824 RepID=A9V8S4_MONBE|nr:uncharacterized protein MONBRDRAFT_28648 [Monosiga brevicollis MX1]EDQ85923.1 predicted protein [Monosiga brevicollis MX1]|eukprot:XP_001749117.1 hypothetical protein [Monosiga brevicollis MX1]